jgi:RNA polymerase sigma factor (sigma-70 family)
MPANRLDSLFGTPLSLRRWDPRSDAELLGRFLDQRDEAAFETLLLRHTPGVRAACRGWLRAASDIDDAAQATFLVLVQRARSIRNRGALGRWLYGVAVNVARRLRQRAPPAGPLPDEVPQRESTVDTELKDLLTTEVAHLPEKYRLPVQLAYWGGLTTAETAERLGWPKGTVLTRLAWARKRLQKSLARHGLAPTAIAGLTFTAAPVSSAWTRTTVRAATRIMAGESLAALELSTRTISLTEGVVRTMFHDKLKVIALISVLVIGLAGFGVFQWVSASDPPVKDGKLHADPSGKETAKSDDPRPSVSSRRREAVIRLPIGTFVKEVEAQPYGSGRLTWTYEEDRVQGHIEASVMGGEADISIETEHALSSTGTMYGLVTAFRLNHIKLPDGDVFAELKPYLGLWSAIEPLVNEVMLDLPFSYQFRMQGDRLIITSFRILLAGPNPLGKLGGLGLGSGGGNNEAFAALAAFQALGTALEGTYMASDSKDRPTPGKRPLFQKPLGSGKSGTSK